MNRNYFQIAKILMSVILFCFSVEAMAVPAKRTPVTVTQPDGSKLTIQKKGDERSHFTTTSDGFLIKQGTDGIYYYQNTDQSGNVVLSSVKANDTPKRSATEVKFLQSVQKEKVVSNLISKQKAKPSKYKAKTSSDVKRRATMAGTTKGIAILVEYQDVKFSDRATVVSRFTDMLNAVDYSENRGTGSARDYFIQNSSGKFTPQFDIYGIVTLPNNMAYYGGNVDNDPEGDDLRPEQMLVDACKALDATVDFSQYDNDNDGVIDNVYVLYAGYGEADGGAANTVWPHAWYLLQGAKVDLKVDGKQVDSYACSNELNSDNTMTGIGTFTHEFCHVLGLPDLYDTSNGDAFTPGAWSILDYGPYNNDGRTPPNMSAYERYALGWIEPQELSSPANMSLQPITSNEAYIIKTPKANEYFMVENRQKEGWDKYLPGTGMLVWHIDFNQSVWDTNTVNNTVSHQYVDIEEAAIIIKSDENGDYYDEASFTYPGSANKKEFTDTTTPTNMKTWAGVAMDKPITEITEAAGLITFKFMGGEELIKAPIAKPATETTETSFIANWEASEGATEYILDVYTLEGTETKTVLSENFSGFAKGTPNDKPSTVDVSASLNDYTQTPGWTGTRVYEAGGSIKVGASKDPLGYITTPTMDLSQSGGSFSMTFDAMAWSGDATQIKIYLDDVLVQTLTGLPNGVGYTFSPFTVELTGGTATSKIKFECNAVAKGRFFLDNLVITQGGAAKKPVLGSPFTETATSKALTGLATNKTYYYVVKAKAGDVVSRSSAVISVSLGTSDINNVISDNGFVFVKNGELNVKVNNTLTNNVQIYNIDGKLVGSKTFANQTTFNISEFSSGVYFVKVGHQVFKVVL